MEGEEFEEEGVSEAKNVERSREREEWEAASTVGTGGARGGIGGVTELKSKQPTRDPEARTLQERIGVDE